MNRSYKYISVLFTCMTSLLGCSLVEEILDESTGDDLLQLKDIELNLIAPGYGELTSIYSCCGVFGANELSTDEAIISVKGFNWFDNGQWVTLHQHTWDADNGYLVGTWISIEEGIAKSNTGLYLFNDYESDLLDSEVASMKAELRFLRAFYRYHMFDLFRTFPLRDENDLVFSEAPDVLAGQEAFDWLVMEIQDILPDLQDHSNVTYGRASRQAALTLLAKLYLNAEVYVGTAMWQECMDACDAIIGSGYFSLADDFFQLFSYNNDVANPEAIFVIRQSELSENRIFFTAAWTLHYAQTFGENKLALNGWATTETFFNRWDEDENPGNGITTSDLRFQDDRIRVRTGANLGFLVGPQFNPDGSPIEDPQLSRADDFVQLAYTPDISDINNSLDHEGVRILKYTPDPESTFFFNGRNDFLIFRYADVMMMKAECLLRQGNDADALAMVNTLRGLRGASSTTTLTLQDLLDERGFEFYWEGHRRQDLIRFNQYSQGSWAFKEVVDKTRDVFPVPQLMIDINSNLVQNPGY